MPRLLVLGVALACAACREAATEEIDEPDAPCAGCTFDVPDGREGEVPLLVVLHGNHETTRAARGRWIEATRRRGWALLALQCPRDEGCDRVGRWYAWNGSPSWITEQVSTVMRAIPVDQQRIYLAGWSGGANYVGMHADAWPHLFAGLVIHGGGQPPRSGRCPPRALPAYFLISDARAGARRLRSYLEKCDQELGWDVLPDASHAREDAALDVLRATKILDWLDQRARPRPVS